MLSEDTLRPTTAMSDRGILEHVLSTTTPKVELADPVDKMIAGMEISELGGEENTRTSTAERGKILMMRILRKSQVESLEVSSTLVDYPNCREMNWTLDGFHKYHRMRRCSSWMEGSYLRWSLNFRLWMHLNRSKGQLDGMEKTGFGFASLAYGRSEEKLMVLHSNGVYDA